METRELIQDHEPEGGLEDPPEVIDEDEDVGTDGPPNL